MSRFIRVTGTGGTGGTGKREAKGPLSCEIPLNLDEVG